MTTPTDDDRDLVTVVAVMRAAPGRTDELRAALTGIVGPTMQEDGCVNYDLHEGMDEEGLFVFYENWESAEHLAAHSVSSHIEAFTERAGDLLTADGAAVMRLQRIA